MAGSRLATIRGRVRARRRYLRTIDGRGSRGHRDCGGIGNVKMLRHIELKSGYSDNGPAWIGYVTSSKTGRTVYFNGRAVAKYKGQKRDCDGGNYRDLGSGESFWVSGLLGKFLECLPVSLVSRFLSRLELLPPR
jgi:hypothetical protein